MKLFTGRWMDAHRHDRPRTKCDHKSSSCHYEKQTFGLFAEIFFSGKEKILHFCYFHFHVCVYCSQESFPLEFIYLQYSWY